MTDNHAPICRLRTWKLTERIDAYIDRHLPEKLTLHSVAAEFGVSPSTVAQVYRKENGISFHQALKTRRMEAACALLLDGVLLTQIGKAVGYQDYAAFYRAFLQTYGMSPREYRANHDNQSRRHNRLCMEEQGKA